MSNEGYNLNGKDSNDIAWQEVRNQQNATKGIIAGVLAAVLGALIWGLITYVTDYQIGWMAIAVGFMVGKSIAHFGNTVDNYFRIIGAILALLGCLLGNLIAFILILANAEGIKILELIPLLDFASIIELYKITFSPMDILFYGLATYEGFRFSIKLIKNTNVKPQVEGDIQ